MALIAIVVMACNTLSPAERAERDARIAQAVEKALAARRYTVEISTMYPSHGRVRQVSPEFGLLVKGDTLMSYLPYVGRAYSVPYGGGTGLNFTEPIEEYKAEKGKNGTTQILIKVSHEADLLSYQLEVFDNGNTTINLTSRERESISYSGNLVVK